MLFRSVGGVCAHGFHQGIILGGAGDAGLLEVQFRANDLVVEVVVGEVGGDGGTGVGGGGRSNSRHIDFLSGSLAVAVGRNPNFIFLYRVACFFVSLTLYTRIIPQRVSNRADTPKMFFTFFKKFFKKMMGS